MKNDRVLTINDYYDGPRLGIAEMNGVPHIYEAEFDHNTEEYGDTYFLSPVEQELLALVLEDWQIWLRWEAALKRGEISVEAHPALPSERSRHEELKAAIGNRLKSDPTNRTYMKGKFSTAPIETEWKGMLVEWEPQ